MCNPGHIKTGTRKLLFSLHWHPFIFFDLIGPMSSTGRGVTLPLYRTLVQAGTKPQPQRDIPEPVYEYYTFSGYTSIQCWSDKHCSSTGWPLRGGTKREQFIVDSHVKQAVFTVLLNLFTEWSKKNILVSMFSSYLHDNTEAGDYFFRRLLFILLVVKMYE